MGYSQLAFIVRGVSAQGPRMNVRFKDGLPTGDVHKWRLDLITFLAAQIILIILCICAKNSFTIQLKWCFVLHTTSTWLLTRNRNISLFPSCLRNPFIQLLFKTVVFTIQKGNSISLAPRHNIIHMASGSLIHCSRVRWQEVILVARTCLRGTGWATVKLDVREISFTDSINHGKHLTQYIWWPHSTVGAGK